MLNVDLNVLLSFYSGYFTDCELFVGYFLVKLLVTFNQILEVEFLILHLQVVD